MHSIVQQKYSSASDGVDRLRWSKFILIEPTSSRPPTPYDQESEAIGNTVITTAADMQEKPAGHANFFDTLLDKIGATPFVGKYNLRPDSPEYTAASRR